MSNIEKEAMAKWRTIAMLDYIKVHLEHGDEIYRIIEVIENYKKFIGELCDYTKTEIQENKSTELNILMHDRVVQYVLTTGVLGVYDNEHIEDAKKKAKEKYPEDDFWESIVDLNEIDF